MSKNRNIVVFWIDEAPREDFRERMERDTPLPPEPRFASRTYKRTNSTSQKSNIPFMRNTIS